MTASAKKISAELVTTYGEGQRARIERGLKQVADFWRKDDGDAPAYEEFVRNNFADNRPQLIQCSIGLSGCLKLSEAIW